LCTGLFSSSQRDLKELISARVPPGRNVYRGACCRSSGI